MAETVPPSPDPDSATATGTGGSSGGAAVPPADSASTSGLGTHDEQQGDPGTAPEAPYDLDDQEANPTEPRSPSGT